MNSYIFEFTLFEFQPLSFHSFMQQPTDEFGDPLDLLGFIKNMDKITLDMLNYHFNLSYFLDFLSLKMYWVEYPTFCTVDLGRLIKSAEYFECGYHGDQKKRIVPLHSVDPNIYYSMLRFLAPNVWGRHQISYFDFEKIIDFIKFGPSYHKD